MRLYNIKNRTKEKLPKTTWLIIDDLPDCLAVLEKSEIYNVNANMTFYMIFGFM